MVTRRCKSGIAATACCSASRIDVRLVPFRKICARYSPRSLPSGAGAGPSTWNAAGAGARPHARGEIGRVVHRTAEGRRADDGVDQADHRRIPHRPPVANLVVVEGAVVLAARELDAVMLRKQRLHDRLAGEVSPARTSGDLRQQLEGALARAEIGQAEADVG